MISVTESAGQQITQQLLKRGQGIGIRIGVKTTGCSGLAYVLEYVDDLKSGDNIEIFEGYSIIVNKKDEPYLQGLTVDYCKKGLNEGFEFLNPNERDRCGCGESFRV
jgi:iron-sulfur cluster assembly protein